MIFSYTDHALKRMNQKTLSKRDVEFIVLFLSHLESTYFERMKASRQLGKRKVRVVYSKREKDIRIITVVTL